MGRKEVEYPCDWIAAYSKYKTRDLTGTKATEQLGLKRNTFYKLVKSYEEGVASIPDKTHANTII